MKFLSLLVKMPIDIFSFFIGKNRAATHYLLSRSLDDEVTKYIEDEYYVTNYAHIKKTIKLAGEKLKTDFSIVDVGGADGVTPKFFSLAFPKSNVIIFEPLKVSYEVIEKMMSLFPKFCLIKKAVGNSVGTSEIHIAGRTTASSLFELNPDDQSTLFKDALSQVGKELIEVTTLDSELVNVSCIGILKIDVQGYELEVLKGGTETLKKTSIITLEMNNHDGYKGAPKYYEIDEYLRHANFTLYDIFPSTKDAGQLKEWDSIYINNACL